MAVLAVTKFDSRFQEFFFVLLIFLNYISFCACYFQPIDDVGVAGTLPEKGTM